MSAAVITITWQLTTRFTTRVVILHHCLSQLTQPSATLRCG